MKKILLFVMLCMVSFNVNAQIQRNFFGLTLGVSTRQQVETKVRSMGTRIRSYDKENIFAKKMKFGGKEWDDVLFQFYNNKLLAVIFSVPVLTWEGKSSIIDDWNSFNSSLKDKYGKFCYIDNENDISYFDGSTLLSLKYKNIDSTLDMFTLFYSDYELSSQKDKSIKDEL